MEYPIRIGKYVAHKGYASRRGATEIIKRGLVHINARTAVVTDMVEEGDKVVISKKVLRKEYVYFAYHKPLGLISVKSDGGDESIEERIKKTHDISGVFPIGRLDKQSSGLIILTNDGRITAPLLDPELYHEKEYRVSVNKKLARSFKEKMEAGVDIEGYTTKPCTIRITGDRSFAIIITEGKRHQIRRMCMNLGYTVTSLQRVRMGSIRLGTLPVGEMRPLTEREISPLLVPRNS